MPWRRATKGFLPFMLVAATALVAPLAGALFQVPDESSPATGTSQLVAQGVVAIPKGDLIWEVSERVAPPPANASPTTSGLGFLIVLEGVLLVEDGATGEQFR